MKKNLIVIQEGSKECGAAALLSIIRYYQGNCSINKLLELTNTTKQGTNFYNIKVAAEKIGLSSKAFHIKELEKLDEISTPILCQLINNNFEHFVVIYKIKKDSVVLMDPSKGKVTIKKEKFKELWTGYIMIFEPYKKLLFIEETKYLNQVMIEVIIKNKDFVINIVLLSLIFTFVSCIYAFYMEIVIDYILNTTYSNLNIITFIFAIILIIKCLSNYFRNNLLIIMNKKIDCSLMLNTFQKVLLLPYNYYRNKTTGDMISRMNDLAYLKVILNKIILTVLLDFFISIVASIILYKISSQMFSILLIIILIYIFILYIFRPILRKLTNISQENNAAVNSFFVESISGFETIKGLNMEGIMYEKFEKLYTKQLNTNSFFENINNIEIFLKDLFTLMGLLMINYIGFQMIMENIITIGSLVTFNSLLIFFIDPIRNVIDLNKEYYYASNALKRANHMFEVETENLEKESNLEINGNINIKNLSFSYHQVDILKNINVTIKKESKTLLLGKSGSGKSTLLKILYKYYNVKRDHIYINSYDINDLRIKDIRKNIAYISQNEILYTDSIRNNIILDRKITEQEFQTICKLTYVDEIVQNLFLGYDTKLEENGLNISGGQRQRIILARALLKNSDIILIDEGLNEIDINLERKILKNLFKYFKNKTFIIIAHRLENMDLYNQVIKIENGTVLENLKKRGGNNA